MARQAIVVASYYLFGWARKPGTQSRRRRGSETNDCWECQERVGIELQLDWGGNERRPVTFINPYTGARSFCCSEFCSWFELPRTSKHHNLLQVRYPARNSALEIKDLFSMVGAGRFERPTPCAQVGFRRGCKIVRLQLLSLQADLASLLHRVEPYRMQRLSAATNSSTALSAMS
jgi:hypothetical protein